MIFGIGVDIVKIDRFENNHFIKHVFTEREREYFSKKNTQTIAGIFAAKEAVAKAMGTGFSGFFPIDIEILHKESGKPFVVLHNKAKKTMRRLLKRPHRFSYARKLLSQFPSPMGATPPNPLASVGKAHFRSAAVGGAPHFVRRKNAANAAFSIHISISHTSVEAVAYCVIEIYNVFTGRGSFVPKHR